MSECRKDLGLCSCPDCSNWMPWDGEPKYPEMEDDDGEEG